ncbi:hypothetical protein L6164_031734 [Bauhinia variegata]|uniref:Uncharacterized protein n=1 Tax=Bauhinia variegata TaxID=167791 RepID=A0ACB9KLW5_BAUVA|nr:hypothetical protein L6164_031734 [Bauhinia variegata]
MDDERPKTRKPRPTSTSSISSFSSTARALFFAMARKSVLKQTLATFFLVIVMYVLFNTFFHPTDSSKLDTSFPFNTNTATVLLNDVSQEVDGKFSSSSPPVKVYLYDLPSRFTFGIIEHHSLARGGHPAKDVTILKYPGHQHMSEWYMFLDLDRPQSERVGSPIVRVLDPEEADLFYVPFFSSLSLIVNPIMRHAEGSEKPLYNDEENQLALVEWLEKQEYWRRNNGRDHVIMASDPNALYRVIDRVKNTCCLCLTLGVCDPTRDLWLRMSLCHTHID